MKFKKLMACAVSLAVAAAVIPQTAFAAAGDDPYFETDEWGCVDRGDSIALECYLGEDVNVVIPEEINGKKVTALWGTFMLAGEYGYADIETVYVPASIEFMGGMALEYSHPFYGAEKLVSITVDEKNENFKSVDGVLFSKDMSELCVYPAGKTSASYEIPDGVEGIGKGAFYRSQLTSVTIPDTVTVIGGEAFYFSQLTYVTIPDSVTTIGSHALNSCSSLTAINVNENNKNFSSIDGVLFNKDVTTLIQFPCCKNVTSYVIPDSVITILDAFTNCSSLTEITIPASVTEIGGSAFYGCSLDLTIYGYKNSYAESYAEQYGIKFSPLPVTVKNENATVEGILPYDTTLNVEKTDESETSVTFDITLADKDGNAVQPTEAVSVKLPVPEGMATEGLKVYRAESNGKYTDMKATFADGSMTFTTDHFSTYVITAEELDKEQSGGSGSSGGSTGGSGSSSGSTGSTGSESASDTAAPETSSDTSASSTEGSTAGSTDSEDKNQNTGVALLVLPAAIAAAGIVISRKRR